MSESPKKTWMSVLAAVFGLVPWAMLLVAKLGSDYSMAIGPLIPLAMVLAPAAIVAGIVAVAGKHAQRALAVMGIVLGVVFLGLMGMVLWALMRMDL